MKSLRRVTYNITYKPNISILQRRCPEEQYLTAPGPLHIKCKTELKLEIRSPAIYKTIIKKKNLFRSWCRACELPRVNDNRHTPSCSISSISWPPDHGIHSSLANVLIYHVNTLKTYIFYTSIYVDHTLLPKYIYFLNNFKFVEHLTRSLRVAWKNF